MKSLQTKGLLAYLIEGKNAPVQLDSYIDTDAAEEIYFLNTIVLYEVAAFFEQNIRFGKADLLTVLKALISNSQIRFENRELVIESVERYQLDNHRRSFSDYLKSVINDHYQKKDLHDVK